MTSKAKKRGRTSARNSLDASVNAELLAAAASAEESESTTSLTEPADTPVASTSPGVSTSPSDDPDNAPLVAPDVTSTPTATSASAAPSSAGLPPKASRRRGGGASTPVPNPNLSASDSSPSSAPASKKSRKLSSQQSPTQAAAMAAIHAAVAAEKSPSPASSGPVPFTSNPSSALAQIPHPYPYTQATHPLSTVQIGGGGGGGGGGAATSPSPGPVASPDDDNDDNVSVDGRGDLSASGRGYMAQFYWQEHYNKTRASASDPVPRSTRANQTENVPSIPTMFHKVIQVLQEVEWDVTGIDILPLIDRKIVRPLSVRDKTYDKKLLLTTKTGVQYVVQACRKEHVKLLFEGSKGGLLGELGLCPQLLDVYSISPGRKVCVGGVGPLVREKGGASTTKSTACICIAAETRLRNGLGGAILPPGLLAQANQANAQAHYEDDSKANLKGRRTPVPRDSVTPDVKPVKTSSNGSNHAGTGDNDVNAEQMELDILLEDLNSLDSTDMDMNGGGTTAARSGTPVRGRPSQNSDATTLRKKIATQTKAIQQLQMQLRQEQEQAMAWRQKWNEEHDLNIRLWDRLNAFQRKLEKMSRPLNSWYYAYSGASAYRPYPLEPFENPTAATTATAPTANMTADEQLQIQLQMQLQQQLAHGQHQME